MPAEVADDLYGRLRQAFGVSGVVLDVGIGSGEVSGQLVSRGVPLVLMDVTDLRGPDAPKAPFVLGSACELPIATASVAGVHLARVLHHVPDWRLALAEVVRVLVPGGSLCLTLGGRLHASKLGALRDAVFSAGARFGLREAHHAHGPSGAVAVDAELAVTPEVIEVSYPVWGTPRESVTDAASHPYAWEPRQDLSPLAAVAEQVLADSGLPPDEPIRHDRIVSYRVYRIG